MTTATLETAEARAVEVTETDRFLFDLQGFLLLKGVLSPGECRTLLDTVQMLERRTYDETERLKRTWNGHAPQPTLALSTGRTRLNGLLRLDPSFDELIDHPRVLPLLQAFMQEPQLVNTWSISKREGDPGGAWHRGRDPSHYTFRNGRINSRMLNVVWFLTDNGPEDGCMLALPGGHKSNIDVDHKAYDCAEMPGCVRVTGHAGDVFLFSETVLHTGLKKTTGGTRTNLYYNYTTRDFNVMTYSPQHNYHFCMPPRIRARFTPQRRVLTAWMEHFIAED